MAKLAAYDFDVVSGKITHTEHLNYILGLDKKLEITDQIIAQYTHHEDKKMVFDKRQESIAHRKDTFYRFRLKSEKFEDWHWFQGATHVVLDENKKLDYVVNVLQDITETVNKENSIQELLHDSQEKQAELSASEEELRQNSEELQTINDNLFIAQRESEEKQHLLNRAENIAKMGSLDFDLQANTYSYSENLVTIFGLDDSKMTSPKRHLKYIHSDDKGEVENLFLELMQGKRDSIDTITRFKGINHEEWKFLKMNLYLLRDFNESPARVLGVIQDVTEAETNKIVAEKSQIELQEQKLLLQDSEKMAKMGSYVWDIKTDTLKTSDNLPIIYGFDKDKVIDRELLDHIMHSDDSMTNKIVLQTALKNKDDSLFIYYKARANENQDWKHFQSFAFIKYNEDKEPITLIATVQDITKEVLKNTETELLLDEFSKNKSYLDEAQSLAKIVSYDMDIYSEAMNWSDSFVNVFGVSQDIIPTYTTDFQEWIEPEDLEKAITGWGNAVHLKSKFEELYRINTPKGNKFYIRERGYPVFDSNGNLISVRGTLQDITQTELAKAELDRKSKQIEKQNHKFVGSVNYAQRIQSAMLGGTQELKNTFEDGFIFFEPKDVVSGDFYWYSQLDEHRKIAIVGDCTGHGVPGAFMSLLGTTILNQIILQQQITTPSKILDTLQKEIKKILNQENTGNKDGMDIAVVLVDESVGMLEFAGAKNPLVCINKRRKRGGASTNLTIIKGDNLSVGGRNAKVEEQTYTNHIVNIEDIDAFYLYSDGYQDQFGGEKDGKFMSTRFRQLLYDTHSTSMRHQRVALKRTLMNWMGTENEQIDDICVMGISV